MKCERFTSSGLILYLALFLWYSLIFFDIPRLLVPGPLSVFSLSSLLELFLVLILAGYLLGVKVTDYFCLPILGLWGYLQYRAHWRYLVSQPSRKVLARYYHYFHGTLRFFPPSRTRLVPDAYHTVLGLFILLNLLAVSVRLVRPLLRTAGARVP